MNLKKAIFALAILMLLTVRVAYITRGDIAFGSEWLIGIIPLMIYLVKTEIDDGNRN